ncbi:hypothetical protein [Bernardetia sp.]|uniref:hypothetical protein n=1 Tax=Bernardetia sp. TaxID=1937974 RepID=UPI0025C00253|nr:hypothetical protein [Bernardetia sp.]
MIYLYISLCIIYTVLTFWGGYRFAEFLKKWKAKRKRKQNRIKKQKQKQLLECQKQKQNTDRNSRNGIFYKNIQNGKRVKFNPNGSKSNNRKPKLRRFNK